MKNKISIVFVSLFLAVILMTSVLVIAKPSKPAFLPDHVVEIFNGVFSLGDAVDPATGKVVEGILFTHGKRANAKPPWAGGGGKDNGGTSTCYEFMSKGAKWKSVEDYMVDPSNAVGLDEAFVRSSVASDAQKWEDASGVNIFGNEVAGVVDGDDQNSPDNKNEVMFTNLGPTNTIAYTIVWGIFSGKPANRELVEWDMVFNEDFDWSASGEAGKMDFENIDTHEIGHAAGLTHPETGCTEETMYAYASLGETKKRDLNAGDISGISDLYN